MNARRVSAARALFLAAFCAVILVLYGCAAPPSTALYPPTPPPEMQRYVLQLGDTLESIARAHGLNWRDVLDANPGMDPHKLLVDAVISIPPSPGVAPTAPGAAPTAPVAPAAPAPAAEVLMNPGQPEPIPAEGNYVWPLRGAVIARFGEAANWRMDEESRGIDIRAQANEIVVAAKSGQVITFQHFPILGRMVALRHSDGTMTFYGHNDRLLVTHGTWVRQGEPIAVAGGSGRASGTELHFRIWVKDRFVDPLTRLPR